MPVLFFPNPAGVVRPDSPIAKGDQFGDRGPGRLSVDRFQDLIYGGKPNRSSSGPESFGENGYPKQSARKRRTVGGYSRVSRLRTATNQKKPGAEGSRNGADQNNLHYGSAGVQAISPGGFNQLADSAPSEPGQGKSRSARQNIPAINDGQDEPNCRPRRRCNWRCLTRRSRSTKAGISPCRVARPLRSRVPGRS